LSKLKLEHSPEQKLQHPVFDQAGVEVFVKRDDLLHPDVSGNKWRKLKYNLELFYNSNYTGVLSFGGAFSNHLVATAAACAELEIPCVGIVRGLHVDLENDSLSRCRSFGMRLIPVEIKVYDQLARISTANSEVFRNSLSDLADELPNYLAIPEGGANAFGKQGCAEIVEEFHNEYDLVMCPLGSATTFCGLLSALSEKQKGIAVAALKGVELEHFVEQKLDEFAVKPKCEWEVIQEDKFGGFAKINQELIRFKEDFETHFSIELDYIYTCKMFFHLFDMVKNGQIKRGSRVLCIHTGGLQGNSSIKKRYRLKQISVRN